MRAKISPAPAAAQPFAVPKPNNARGSTPKVNPAGWTCGRFFRRRMARRVFRESCRRMDASPRHNLIAWAPLCFVWRLFQRAAMALRPFPFSTGKGHFNPAPHCFRHTVSASCRARTFWLAVLSELWLANVQLFHFRRPCPVVSCAGGGAAGSDAAIRAGTLSLSPIPERTRQIETTPDLLFRPLLTAHPTISLQGGTNGRPHGWLQKNAKNGVAGCELTGGEKGKRCKSVAVRPLYPGTKRSFVPLTTNPVAGKVRRQG